MLFWIPSHGCTKTLGVGLDVQEHRDSQFCITRNYQQRKKYYHTWSQACSLSDFWWMITQLFIFNVLLCRLKTVFYTNPIGEVYFERVVVVSVTARLVTYPKITSCKSLFQTSVCVLFSQHAVSWRENVNICKKRSWYSFSAFTKNCSCHFWFHEKLCSIVLFLKPEKKPRLQYLRNAGICNLQK